MNGLVKPFRKKSDPKNRKKNSKNQSEIAACEQKTTSKKANLCTDFLLYFKIRVKKFHAAKPLAFSLQNQSKNVACEQKTTREKWNVGSNKKLGWD